MSRYMVLHYNNFECKDDTQEDGVSLIDYDYKIYVDYNLVSEYIISELLGYFVFKSWGKERQEGFMSALRYCEHMDLFEDMDFNDKFYDWCMDKFEEEAQEQCHEDYDGF